MSELPDKARLFLEQLAGDDSIEALRKELEMQKNSSDLNEQWIAAVRLDARELLDEFTSGSSSSE